MSGEGQPASAVERGPRRAPAATARIVVVVVVAFAAALAFAACSRRGGPPRRPPLPAGQAEAGGPPFLAVDAIVDEPVAAATTPGTVVDLRAASHDGFDRIAIELAGSVPGYRVAWAKAPPRQCGSGEPLAAPGRAWLEVRLDHAQAHDEQGRGTVEKRSSRPGLPAVEAITFNCDFEGQTIWAIGAPRQLPFRVLALHDPPRIVVDVAHAPAAAATPAP